MTGSDYLLGSDAAELRRLGFQHAVWSETARALWRRAGFGPGMRLVDLGAGPGYASLELVDLVGPGGRVIAVEPAERFAQYLREQKERRHLDALEVRQVRAEDMHLPSGGIDGVYARWVCCFLPNLIPVLSAVFDALAPRGALAVQDYVNYGALTLAPRSRTLDRVVEAAIESWKRSGGDLDVGTRLPGILTRLGFEIREVTAQCRVALPGTPLWEWPKGFFFGYAPRLVEMGLLDEHERVAFEREWLDREVTPGAFFLTPPMIDLIAVRRA